MEDENSLGMLRLDAMYEICNCCQSTCEQHMVMKYIDKLEQEIENLKKELKNGSK